MSTTTIAATRALTELVHTARDRSLLATLNGETAIALGLARLAVDFDSTRTCLAQEGVAYLDAAWAFVDVGRRFVAQYSIQLARAGVVAL